MAFVLGKKSLAELQGVHPSLVKVAKRAIQITTVDFRITDGLRTLAEQRKYVASGASKTMRSKHLTGRAIDFVALPGGRASYDRKSMLAIANAFKLAAKELKVPVEWGGDWKSFVDMPHVQLKDGWNP